VTRGLHPVNLALEASSMTLATDADPRFESERNLGLIIYGLLFAALFFAGVPALVAVVIAYTQTSNASAAMKRHYRFQIQIFWIGFLLALIAGISGLWAILDVAGQVWSNSRITENEAGVDFDLTQMDMTGRILGLFGLSALALVLMTLWSLCAPAVGFIRLATQPRTPAP
jgi:uncharacterized membrane protein